MAWPKRLSASSAGQFIACHASANLPLAIPGWEEPVRDENVGAKAAGTGVHALLEAAIAMQYVTKSKTQNFGAKDMLHIGMLFTYLGELWSTRRFNILSEHTVKATWLQTEPTTTADIVLYVQDEIHVLDAKWGKIPVDVVENEQLMYYAACYMGLAPKAKGVTVHILQPRADNMTSWFISADRLAQFMDEAVAAEKAILAGSTTFGPTDHHCTFCPANPHSRGDKAGPYCPALMQLLYPKVIDTDGILDL